MFCSKCGKKMVVDDPKTTTTIYTNSIIFWTCDECNQKEEKEDLK